ncbi:hypothetical protein K488DRAFT_33856, partial [Vararia minispora EC-137]
EIPAIIDTGSQLNLMSAEVAEAIRQPRGSRPPLPMEDANGGQKVLDEVVRNVPVSVGTVTVPITFHINKDAPFNILLGRPW